MYFASWLKEHGETKVVVDRRVVGIREMKTRLSASFTAGKGWKRAFREVEFKIKLPTGDQSSIRGPPTATDTQKWRDDQALSMENLR